MRYHTGLRLTPERDLKILEFIWKWKLAPTAVIHKRFFPKSSLKGCFNCLAQLRRGGYIQTVYVLEQRKFAWTLLPKGFETIKETLPASVDAGFKSEAPNHDLIALSLNLGAYESTPDFDELLFSEQQLRRLNPESYYDWIPKDLEHRPDGYIRVKNGSVLQTTALEIELSPKLVGDYKNLAFKYSECKEIDHVLWAVPTPRMALGLSKVFKPFEVESKFVHSFVIAKDVLSLGWKAKVISGVKKDVVLSDWLQLN